MARFPIQRAEKTLPGVGPSVRADVDVRTGEQGIAGLGFALMELGVRYDAIQAQTQLSEFQRKANEEINKLALSFNTNLNPDTYPAEYKKSVEAIHTLMPSNRRAARNAQIWLNAKEPAWQRDVDMARLARAGDNWLAELFEKQATIGTTGEIGSFPGYIANGVSKGWIDKSDSVKILAQTNKMSEIAQITNLYGAGNYEQARNHARASKILSPSERESILNTIDAEERSVQVKIAAELKARQNETARNLLVSLWDGTLTESVLRDATKNGLITYENAKGLRAALTQPKEFNLAAYIKVKNSINSYERGIVDFDDALGVLTTNSSLLGDNGKSLTDKLFAIPNKNEADWEREGLDYIQNQILEKDIFGRIYGSPKEQKAALEARLAYDVALEAAERKGEPIEGRDKLLKAHEIMLKYRPEKKEKPPIEMEKGLGTIPFITDSDIDKAINQAKENLGEKATPQEIKAEALRLLR